MKSVADLEQLEQQLEHLWGSPLPPIAASDLMISTAMLASEGLFSLALLATTTEAAAFVNSFTAKQRG